MKKAAILALLGVAAAGTAAFCAKVIKKYNQEQEDDYTECDCGCDECKAAEEDAAEAAEESAEVCEEAAAEEDAAVAEEAAEVAEEPEVTIELTIEEAKPEENEPEEELEDHEEII